MGTHLGANALTSSSITSEEKEKPGCGTQCPSVVGKVRVGHKLDSEIPESFSSLNNSVILSPDHFLILSKWRTGLVKEAQRSRG